MSGYSRHNRYELFSYHIDPPAYSLVPDKEKQLLRTITGSSEDILILSGGVSMGDADFVPSVLEQAGFRKIFHKVAIKPGKPIWFGKKGNQIAFALPGNPVLYRSHGKYLSNHSSESRWRSLHLNH